MTSLRPCYDASLRTTKDKQQPRSTQLGNTTTEFNHRLVRSGCNLLALLTNDVLAIDADLSDGAVVLTVSLDVLDELGDTEQVVHLLERQTLGLRNEEPNKDEHGETEASVDEESSEYC